MCTIIQPPGKFEGGTCLTHLMHSWANDGVLDYIGVDYVSTVMEATGPFTLDDIHEYQRTGYQKPGQVKFEETFCDECTKDFLNATTIRYWEDTQGFAHSEVL